ncbi:protein of unknown function [Beijerinckiaceae bacterium RH AL1]|nr:hypothetical protein [Beijerinckiaceae bacterium]VVB46063.1 protein of unknown function [Beijerinckiaceae bacterium RH CH11]VVB46145.1 protein of unknown function [Beijerinckiaceae bacterium RH AL8]VVC55184.1 protein of unknown function [Beijerinckiaceae bacterium RH AL1]
MENGVVTAGYLLRLIGFFAIAIGAAWAIQTLGFGHESVGGKLMWVVAAAAMAGAGAGLIVASSSLPADERRVPVRI